MLVLCLCVCVHVLRSVKLITPDYNSSGKIQTHGQLPFFVAVKTNLSVIFGKSTHVCNSYQGDILPPIFFDLLKSDGGESSVFVTFIDK